MLPDYASSLAFHGGNTINELGPIADVLCFFACVERFAADVLGENGCRLVLDRLYKRYLRLEELEPAVSAMAAIQSCFATIPASQIEWVAYNISAEETRHNLNGATLADVMDEHFTRFNDCVESAFGCLQRLSFFRPVKIIRSDFASIDREDKRPLEEYDALDGPPFWLAEPPPPAPSPSYKDGKVVPHGTPGSVRPDYMSPDGMSATFVAKLEN